MSENKKESRLLNSKRNLISGMIKQFVNIFLTFAVRTVILYTLGAEYQGLNGLFSSILQVLNLSELGFSSAVTFILYRPIAENDRNAICAIMAFLKKIYFILGLMILGIGVLILPFIPYLISGYYPSSVNIYFLFFIYLINTVISYLLFAYKSTLLVAMQREDVVSNIYTITLLLSRLIQLVLLCVFKNYYCYVVVLPLCTIGNNILLEVLSKREFPQIIPEGTIDNKTKSEFVKQVKASLVNRICDIARNSLDNIVLSSYIGLVAVAIYDNYFYIFTAVYGGMGIIVHALQASIGNSIVKESVEKNYDDCNKFTFIFMWIVGWCTICMCCLYQPFMNLWMRGDQTLLLSFSNMLLFCVYFYAISMTYTKGIYLEAKGLYHECRKWYVIETIGNLGLNLTLGYYFGITGILIATILTILFINFVSGTSVLFKMYFKKSPYNFYLKHIKYFLITALICTVNYSICEIIPLGGVLGIFVKLMICLFLPNVLYVLTYYKTDEFQKATTIIKKLLARNR